MEIKIVVIKRSYTNFVYLRSIQNQRLVVCSFVKRSPVSIVKGAANLRQGSGPSRLEAQVGIGLG